MFDPLKPYNDLPLLPPTSEIETREVLKRCISARTSLERLRMAAQLIPNQSVLGTIPILEARGSSEIENIVTTNDALFRRASLGGDGDPVAKEADRYRAALFGGFAMLSNLPISTRLAVAVCRDIVAIDLDVRSSPGTALRNAHSSKIIYTPPEHRDRLLTLLANWEAFINEPSDIDPLVKMAVQHYQFEAIHPFIDGNGRTGRIINILSLIQDGLLDLPILYLSKFILANRNEYYRLLNDVTSNGNWVAWVLYMLQAVEETSAWTEEKIRAIRKLMDVTTDLVRVKAPRIYSRELIELLFSQPYCRIGDVVDHGIAQRQAASRILLKLTRLGVLHAAPDGRSKRKLFINWAFSDLLDNDANEFMPYETLEP